MRLLRRMRLMSDLKRAVFRFLELNPKVDIAEVVKRHCNEYKDLNRFRRDVSNSPLAKKLESGDFLRSNHKTAQARPNKNKKVDSKRCYITEDQIRFIKYGRSSI